MTDLASLRTITSPAGQPLLQAAEALQPQEKDFLAHYQLLSRRYPPQLARLALELAIARRKATVKFPFANQLYHSRETLEQASSWEAACYRASRYVGFRGVADLGCSAGSDLLALVHHAPALGLDNDAYRLALAQANLDALGLTGEARLVRADLRQPLPFAGMPALALFFDPARRAGGRRVFSVRDYLPPLDVIRMWLPRHPALAVKLSPGVDLADLTGYDAGIEFISLHGELKESVLWFGPLKAAARQATLLPGAQSLAVETQDELSKLAAPPARLSSPAAYLYEPDPAVLRAGLVRLLAQQLDASQLDVDIAYLTSDTLTPTPFARAWAILDWLPYNLKHLRAHLRQSNVGRVTVKKRGSPLQPEDLIRSLRLSGEEHRVLFLTHLNGRPIVIIAAEPEITP